MKKLAAIAIAISMLTFSGCATEPAKSNSATGESVQAPADMPKVTLDSNGAPVIEKVTSAAPAEFKVAVLTQGSGAIVKKDQQVTVQYTGSVWGGEKFDSSWDRGEPATFPLSDGQLIPGFIKALEGQKIGSRVIAVLPPADGYGANEVSGIPANSTLIFVVDILDAK